MSRDAPGALDALTRLGGTVLAMLHSRLELASLELGEAGGRLVTSIVAGFAAVLLFGGAVAALSAWVAVVLWSTLGQAVLVWLALAYAAAGVVLVWWLRARALAAPPLLADTLTELRRDAGFVQGDAAPRGPADAR
jgi:uncharacterized membrane protein YqjE